MKFVQRSPTKPFNDHRQQGPSRQSNELAKQNPSFDVFYSIDEAVPRMGKRPHTAAGLERRKRSTSKRGTETREAPEPTRSEHLQVTGDTLEYKDGLDTFRFPAPSPRLTPSPRSGNDYYLSSQGLTPPRGPYTSESPKIGVAIGSPSHAPPNWGRSYTADQISTRMPQPTRPAPVPPAQGQGIGNVLDAKGRKASWRAIFRWTSSKPASVQKPAPRTEERYGGLNPAMYSLRAETWAHDERPAAMQSTERTRDKPQCQTDVSIPSPLLQGEAVESPRHGLESPSLKTALKSKIRRLSQSQGPKTPSSRLGLPRWQSSPEHLKTRDRSRHDSPLSPLYQADDPMHVTPTPRLDVPIESAEFERYSIMFAQQLANDGKLSLYERRQSRLLLSRADNRSTCAGPSSNELRIQTQVDGTRQRAATSPHLSRPLAIRVDGRKPTYAIAEGPETAIVRPPTVKRSNTAPVASSSPFKTSFSRRKPTLESSPESPGSICFSEALHSTPTSFTTCTDKGSIQLSTGPTEPTEPAWDMVTPRVGQAESPPTTVTSSGTSRERKSEPYPRVKSPEDLERQMVQVSVARQVSVSRARSRVQEAVATSSFKQPLRPRVVELSRNRKSHVGVVQNVDDDASSTRSRSTSKAGSDVDRENGVERTEEIKPAVPEIHISNG